MTARRRGFLKAAFLFTAFFLAYSSVIPFCHTEKTIEERSSCPAGHFFGLFQGAAAAEAVIVFSLIALFVLALEAPRRPGRAVVLGFSLRAPPAA